MTHLKNKSTDSEHKYSYFPVGFNYHLRLHSQITKNKTKIIWLLVESVTVESNGKLGHAWTSFNGLKISFKSWKLSFERRQNIRWSRGLFRLGENSFVEQPGLHGFLIRLKFPSLTSKFCSTRLWLPTGWELFVDMGCRQLYRRKRNLSGEERLLPHDRRGRRQTVQRIRRKIHRSRRRLEPLGHR